MIGRRTKVVNDEDAKIIYSAEVPDVVFLSNPATSTERADLISNLGQGQPYCLLSANYQDYFTESSTPKSCFDEVRSLVY